jgi:hypothetical protein
MALAFSPRSGGLMVIETFLEGRGRGGGPPLWTGPARLQSNHGSTAGGPHGLTGRTRGRAWAPAGRRIGRPDGSAETGETADGNPETDCHSWGFGPQIGDRSAQYRGQIQAFSGLSYKGSIRRIARPGQGSGSQLATLQKQLLWKLFYIIRLTLHWALYGAGQCRLRASQASRMPHTGCWRSGVAIKCDCVASPGWTGTLSAPTSWP